MFVQTSTATATALNGKQVTVREGFDFIVLDSRTIQLDIYSKKAFEECPAASASKEFKAVCGKASEMVEFAAQYGIALDEQAVEAFICAVQDYRSNDFDMETIAAKPAEDEQSKWSYDGEQFIWIRTTGEWVEADAVYPGDFGHRYYLCHYNDGKLGYCPMDGGIEFSLKNFGKVIENLEA